MHCCVGIMANLNVLADWLAGKVPHVNPERPKAVREWPRVPAGPDRLAKLMNMWVGGLPLESRQALRSFMLHGSV